VTGFFEEVYRIVALIPEGSVATYGQIAFVLGRPQGARAVGWAMRAAPAGRGLPCHRVVSKNGSLAPGHVFGGEEIQRTQLEKESVTFNSCGRVNIQNHLWNADGEP
jgi:methylated-DNA-protein-cysteine methyltransferase related protein